MFVYVIPISTALFSAYRAKSSVLLGLCLAAISCSQSDTGGNQLGGAGVLGVPSTAPATPSSNGGTPTPSSDGEGAGGSIAPNPVATTSVPAATTSVPAATTSVPPPATTSVPAATTSVPPATTSVPPATTSVPPAATSVPPVTDGGAPAASGDVFAFVSSIAATNIFRLDEDAGTLEPLGTTDGAEYWAADPTGQRMYGIVTAAAGVQVMALALDNSGSVSKINEVAIPEAVGATHLSVHPNGRWVLAAHTDSGQASVLPIEADGSVGAPVQLIDNGPKSHFVMADQAGTHVFVPSLEGHFVGQFGFDLTSGQLTPNVSPRSAEVLNARHMDFHPSQRFAYVLGAAASTITSFNYDAASGTLSDPEALPTIPEGARSSSGAAHVVAHPSGRFVYASNRNHDSIAIFSVDQVTGRLSFLSYGIGSGIDGPRDFGIDASGKFMLVSNNHGAGRAVLFSVDEATGMITFLSSVTASPSGMYAGFVSP